MKKAYTREDLVITAFDAEDIITTSGVSPSVNPEDSIIVDYGDEGSFSSW